MQVPTRLCEMVQDVRNGKSRTISIRYLLKLYGSQKRGGVVCQRIRTELDQLGVSLVPDFETTPTIDERVKIVIGDISLTNRGVYKEANQSPQSERKLVVVQVGLMDSTRYAFFYRTYSMYARSLSRLETNSDIEIINHGQTTQRHYRDEYPFYIDVDLVTVRDKGSAEEMAEQLGLVEPGDGNSDDDELADSPAPIVQHETLHIAGIEEAVSKVVDSATFVLRNKIVDDLVELQDSLERKIELLRLESIKQLAIQNSDEEATKLAEEISTELYAKLEHQRSVNLELQTENNSLQEKLAEYEFREDEEFHADDAYPTMESMMKLFTELCDGYPVEIHQNAFVSARKSSCTKRKVVLNFLLTLRDYAEVIHSERRTGFTPEQWFEARGYSYAAKDAEITTHKFGAERSITVGGQVKQLGEHVTLMPNQQSCTSIYFDSKHNGKLLVGYVGPHLRTNSR
jgi:hypothetical protein